MKRIALFAAAALMLLGCNQKQKTATTTQVSEGSVVYMTRDITPEALINIYNALGMPAEGRVAVKISTGEAGNNNHLKAELIGPLVQLVNGKIVECNTAYAGKRMNTEDHLKVIEEHGFNTIGGVDIMDADGEIKIPVRDTTYMHYNIVGKNLQNYDFMINLAHFKGHQMGGFGGVLKNASIGVASTAGKWNIHSAGVSQDHWVTAPQDDFLESMAAAAQSVHEYMGGRVVYINVMNNMSVDCDCDGNPAAPELKDMGIVASLDPVAADQTCLDMVFSHKATPGDDNKPLIQRINRQHGTYITDYAEQIGLGSKKYALVNLDK